MLVNFAKGLARALHKQSDSTKGFALAPSLTIFSATVEVSDVLFRIIAELLTWLNKRMSFKAFFLSCATFSHSGLAKKALLVTQNPRDRVINPVTWLRARIYFSRRRTHEERVCCITMDFLMSGLLFCLWRLSSMLWFIKVFFRLLFRKLMLHPFSHRVCYHNWVLFYFEFSSTTLHVDCFPLRSERATPNPLLHFSVTH